MNGFKTFFTLVKGINRGEATQWSSTYYVYHPFHVEYCKIELVLNPILGTWVGAVAAEYTEMNEKREVYKDAGGYSSVEVVEKLEYEVREWLGGDVYGAGEEDNQ